MKITRNELLTIPTPMETESWRPIPHYDAVSHVSREILNAGLGIKEELFEVNKSGNQMFGNFILDEEKEGISWTVGVRNSHNKLFSLGIVAGTHVIVCSNLIFSGEFIDIRRHTQKLTDTEIKVMANTAIQSVIDNAEMYVNLQLSYKEEYMSFDEMKIQTYGAMSEGVLPPAQFNRFHNALKEERELNGDCVYSFHGGMTRTMKNASLFTINNRSRKLNMFMEDVCNKMTK
ncbi:MAG: hypothetical protein ACTSX0_13750 [Promethearchaeota archaeon]